MAAKDAHTQYMKDRYTGTREKTNKNMGNSTPAKNKSGLYGHGHSHGHGVFIYLAGLWTLQPLYDIYNIRPCCIHTCVCIHAYVYILFACKDDSYILACRHAHVDNFKRKYAKRIHARKYII